ncbi:DUF6431 domain-containing protein [Metallumcola ferriviriculae]|uniref:DUF6431 domain-containing protein n=1 Tax=Metallumcola ferriviriculae TaxID=3039180 RepID=A0AAU0ULX2_9FIRM|nr:DUF6431 domain-containing protein [Desulfitibacteraceae bacterium MK1]
MIILLETALSIKQYLRNWQKHDVDIKCPLCNKLTRRHTTYERQVISKYETHTIFILSRRCKPCNITISLLPSFLKPWQRFANHFREIAGRWHLTGRSLNRITASLSESGISRRTLQRWKQKFHKQLKEKLIQQRRNIIDDSAVADSILVHYRKNLTAGDELKGKTRGRFCCLT